MQLFRPFLLAAAAGAMTLAAQAQTKWDLPAAYPASNFHSVNQAYPYLLYQLHI